MPALGLADFKRSHDFLVGIDSDGCAFDSMEIKHKECFIPNFINYFELQAVSKYAREAAEFTNLYSKSRGANRFLSYIAALDLLEQWPEVQKRNAKIPKMQGVRDWTQRETTLGNPTLKDEIKKTGDPDLKRALEWSEAVNAAVANMVRGVPPFPGVKEALEKMGEKADLIVCSATPNAALEAEWAEHGIAKYVEAICGQESGSKKESLAKCSEQGYEKERMLMIGDAPGDMKAAKAVGCLYYPINPGHEEDSWQRFNDEGIERFFNGTYAGEYEASLIAEFEKFLPEKMEWQK